ncbi:hypothetical protein SELMODRAFT_441012 [Selaginella moellendorffii]|uniref:t-SNARE coiled-coil homology domain-containing protein n=1 Tax=Selaginella moellendorffii TaxID=88036 RepID=D8RG07_SELML|nr:syntaxin-51 [Selaginella moellendorffii]EFJ29214.1 hypothetical protein SELMODRAFT_441012 [Selaginella moellendorffii]|eukprot:XP_002970090.1 syntaxin-51 [Selaginella moellendorffii]
MADAWAKELDEATRLAEEVKGSIVNANSGGMSRGERSRLLSTTKRKILILDNKVNRLTSTLETLRGQLSEKEFFRRQDAIISLGLRVKQLDSSYKSSQNARDDLLADGTRGPPVETDKTTGLDNYGLIAFQRQTMKDQDVDLEDLEKSVVSTKHIALTVNEELDLQAHLLDDMDRHADRTNTVLQNVHKRLVVLSKRAGSSALGCLCLMMLVVVALLLVLLKLIHVW